METSLTGGIVQRCHFAELSQICPEDTETYFEQYYDKLHELIDQEIETAERPEQLQTLLAHYCQIRLDDVQKVWETLCKWLDQQSKQIGGVHIMDVMFILNCCYDWMMKRELLESYNDPNK